MIETITNIYERQIKYIDNILDFAILYGELSFSEVDMAFDVLILVLVVALIFQKLWGALGTKPDSTATPISKETAAKIFDILMKENLKNSKPDDVIDGGELKAENTEAGALQMTLRKIPHFDEEMFLRGAQRAFEIIVSSFAKAETETLKMLVDKNLLKKFEAIIKQRQTDGITAENDFVGFTSTEITNAQIDNKDNALITVRFVSEQANVLRNSEGKVIEGDENFIQSITDIWTFERNIKSASPNWLLVSTKK